MEDDARRRLLTHTDTLLERVERLRLADGLLVPEPLRAEVAQAARAVGESTSDEPPRTLAAVHRYLLRLQGILLSGRARVLERTPLPPAPARAPDLPLLALPARNQAPMVEEWHEQVRLVVQRAHDTARYLAAEADAARRRPEDPLAALRQDQAARAQQISDYLTDEAERSTGRPARLDPDPELPTTGALELENVTIDLDHQTVRQDDREIQLTPTERACLVAFAANPGRILTREALMHLVYGDDPAIDVRSRSIDVHLSHLRAKLGHPPYLTTIPGIGFRAAVREVAGAAPAGDLDQVRQRRREQRRAWARSSPGPPLAPTPVPGRAPDRRPGR